MLSVERIRDNLTEVRQRISDAAQRSDRTGDDITLVAVTKYGAADQTRMIVQAGCYDLGENRPQQLWDKAAALADEPEIRWHQIGHLQRNKAARTVPIIHLLHSADSLRLLAEVNKTSSANGKRASVLLEVNVSGDESKHGWHPSEMSGVLQSAMELKHIDVRGLMTMATLGGDANITRANFAELRSLRDHLQSQAGSSASLHELSMGMSGDYELAIEEGATIVRVGSALIRE